MPAHQHRQRSTNCSFEAALEDYPRQDHRHTLIHATLIPDQVLEKIAELEIGITLQAGFLTSPLEPLGYMEKILGDRAHQINPLRKICDMGIRVSGGSDGPVLKPNPVEGIYAACNQNQPEQRMIAGLLNLRISAGSITAL